MRNYLIIFIFFSIVIMPLDPVLQFPVDFLVVRLSISRVLILSSLFFLILMLYINPFKYRFNKIFLFFYTWVIYYLFTVFWSCGRLENILRNMFLIIFISFVVLLSYILEKENLGRKVIICIAFLSILFALIEQIFGYRLPASRQHFFVYELTSFYVNPAHLGSSLSLSFPWILEGRVYKVDKRFSFVFLLNSLILLFIILRTGTKGSLISFIFSFLLLVIVSFFRIAKKDLLKGIVNYILVISLAIIGLIYLVNKIPPLIRDKIFYFLPHLLFYSESYILRKNIWDVLLKHILDSPVSLIIGYGIGSFNYLFDLSSHNLIFELLIEGGLINVSFFVFLLIYVIYKLSINYNKNMIPIISLLSSVPVFFTLGSFLDFWIFWIVLGVCFARF